MSTKVFDYGLIQKAVVRDNGSVVAYVRVAKADQEMFYVNQDGSIRKEVPLKKDLFDSKSKDTLRFQPVVSPHTQDAPPNPSNFQSVAVGMVGDRIFTEEADGFLGATMVLYEKDAIAKFHAGVTQVSPGYYRTPVQIKDGVFAQKNRDYFELAQVPEARGGPTVKIKDSADGLLDAIWADPTQFNDDWRNHWAATSRHDLAIQRLLDTGELEPLPIQLQLKQPIEEKNMTKVQIGSYSLDVADADIASATNLDRDWREIQEQARDAKKNTDAAATQAGEIDGLKAKVHSLESELTARDSAFAANIQVLLRDAEQCRKDIEVLRSTTTFNLDAAAVALEQINIAGYKAAVVAQARPGEQMAKDAIDGYYKGYMDKVSDARWGLQNGNPAKMNLPPELTRNAPTSTPVSYQDLIRGTSGSYSRGYGGEGTQSWPTFGPSAVL